MLLMNVVKNTSNQPGSFSVDGKDYDLYPGEIFETTKNISSVTANLSKSAYKKVSFDGFVPKVDGKKPTTEKQNTSEATTKKEESKATPVLE